MNTKLSNQTLGSTGSLRAVGRPKMLRKTQPARAPHAAAAKSASRTQSHPAGAAESKSKMALLRCELGDVLRSARLRQRRTLRDVSQCARVSLGYLSEVERGHKEASSELLASICEALDMPMWEMLHEVADRMATAENPRSPEGRVPRRNLSLVY
jgi:hypothetical protein